MFCPLSIGCLLCGEFTEALDLLILVITSMLTSEIVYRQAPSSATATEKLRWKQRRCSMSGRDGWNQPIR